MLAELYPSEHELPRLRAEGVVNNLVPIVRLGLDQGMSLEQLAQWNLERYDSRGFFDLWNMKNGWGNVEAFLRMFVTGRSLIYERGTITQLDADRFEVRTPVWYLLAEPQVFYFYDIEPELFTNYIKIFTPLYAARFGIQLAIDHTRGEDGRYYEIALIERMPS